LAPENNITDAIKKIRIRKETVFFILKLIIN
jgi:hypothetical protein